MMAAQHTPGPWRLNAGDETLIMGRSHSIARALCGGMTGIKVPEAEANARLIAAAPDLLEQLRFAVSLLRPLAGNTAQVEAMEAAIAKASSGI